MDPKQVIFSQISSLTSAMGRISSIADPDASDYIRAISAMIDDLYAQLDALDIAPGMGALSAGDLQQLQQVQTNLANQIRDSAASSQSIYALAQLVDTFRGVPA